LKNCTGAKVSVLLALRTAKCPEDILELSQNETVIGMKMEQGKDLSGR